MAQPPPDLMSRHLAMVIESSDDAIVSKSLDGTIVSWNDAAERMFGYSADEAVGRSIRMIIPEDRQSEEDEVLARIRAGHAVTHYETVRRRKDGSTLTISLSVSPIRDQEGRVIGASKIARDISEQVRLRRLVNEHLADTLKIGAIGATVAATLDRETILQQVTDAARDLTRADFGAFFFRVRNDAGDSFVLHTLSARPETSGAYPDQRVTALFERTFRGDAVVRLADVTEDHRFGQHAIPGVSAGPPIRSVLAVIVRGRSGDVLGSLFFGTSRADAFTDQHERLAVGIASWASVALENARLYIEAQEANRMKDEFLAVLSHELRTPLNAIVGYARLLRGGILTGDQVGRGLETLERNANWLTQIVEDVLDVSRIVSGKLRLEIQPVALAPVVENAVATVQPAADAKGIAIVSALDAQAGLVPGDPDRLQQVAWNLLSNAVKFTPSGGRIHVRLDRVGALAELVVSDSGSGISQDFLPYVFERFRQADTGPTRKTGGLGLGLAIVRHIVEMHGGTVQATSGGEGRGATFRVRLPLMQALRRPEQPRAGHLSPALASPLSGLSDLSGVRVTAIDDEEDALQLLRIMLEAAGAAVDIFRSPRQALSALEASPPDVLVVDLGMPEMDGLEVIRRVRGSRAPRLKDVPAVALTAFARSEDRARALRAGFELHLPKPVDPGDLVAAVERLVHGTRSAG